MWTLLQKHITSNEVPPRVQKQKAQKLINFTSENEALVQCEYAPSVGASCWAWPVKGSVDNH